VLGENNIKGTNVVGPPPLLIIGQRRLPTAVGYPVPVRPDGTVHLPLIDPIKVEGLTLGEAEDIVRSVYAKQQIVPACLERILVSLMYGRQTHVVVLRQESGNISVGPTGGLAGGKRSTGHLVDLQAYENDVLHALASSGGLPGLDAYNQIIVFRNCCRTERERTVLLEKLRSLPAGTDPVQAVGAAAQTIRIPLRRKPGEDLPFGPGDVILHTGDVVFLESRDLELFYTGGLLPANEHVLPRDYDLDVIKAISRAQGPLVNGAFNTNNLAGNLITPGLGVPSPRLLTVLRRTPDGGQVAIRVDLHRALRDVRERIIVRPGDVLILQEEPTDALARYFSQALFNFNVAWHAIQGSNVAGFIDVAAPDRLTNPAVNLNAP
jgi:protein involved in polysaccharide export with SLBB domain